MGDEVKYYPIPCSGGDAYSLVNLIYSSIQSAQDIPVEVNFSRKTRSGIYTFPGPIFVSVLQYFFYWQNFN